MSNLERSKTSSATMLDRIYHPAAYDPDTPVDAYWKTTTNQKIPVQEVEGTLHTDTVIIGAGFTGLSAAIHLARDHRINALIVDANEVGWGASGRNGGFACIGSAKLGDAKIIKKFGEEDLKSFYAAQKGAVDLVEQLVIDNEIAIDIVQGGEYCMAHRKSDFENFPSLASHNKKLLGAQCEILGPSDLREAGLYAPGFFGALHLPIGFGINPRKYVLALGNLAIKSGCSIYSNSPVTLIEKQPDGTFELKTPKGRIIAQRLILAANGYNSDNLPDWLNGKYLPVISHVMVTEPIPENLLLDQGWTSHRIAYDSRNLLHYFRLLPDNRMLFGMRGALNLDPQSVEKMKSRIQIDFATMFPAFSSVKMAHHWSGLVCTARNLTPYVGPLGEWKNAWTALAYHGNGVAMGTYSGKLLAGLCATKPYDMAYPKLLQHRLSSFPFPRFRRHALRWAFYHYAWKDRG